MKKLYSNFLLILLVALSIAASAQQPGTLDSTFSFDGKVTTNLSNNYDEAQALAVQTDGKIVVAGYSNNGNNNDFAVVRYNADGTLDYSFGTGGYVIINIGNSDEKAFAVAIQPDQKIVIAGTSNGGNNNDFALLRISGSGQLDNTFGNNGMVITNAGYTTEEARALAIQSDGKIIIGGSSKGIFSNSDFTLIRYNSNGSIDPDFGSNGIVKTDLANSSDFLYSLLIQGDQKIIAVGSTTGSSPEDFAAVRYNKDGSLDQSFGNEGKSITEITGSDDEPFAAALQLDGKLVLAGTANNGNNYDFAILRLDTNGIPDRSFGNNGKVLTALGANDKAYGIVIQNDGRIIAAGVSVTGGGSDFALARYNINGNIDNTFDYDGKVLTNFGPGADVGTAVALQNDGKLVVCGSSMQSNVDFAIARYLSEINLSVSENHKKIKLGIYYNQDTYDLTVNGTEERGQINVFDIIGNKISNGETNSRKTVLNTGPIAPGVYLLNYENGRNSNAIRFVVR